MTTRVVVTGAPGTGKTSLLAGLSRWGPVVPEPARALAAEHQAATGEPSLDHRPALFVDRLLARSIETFDRPPASDIVFYDPGLPDRITYAHICGLDKEPARRASVQRRLSRPGLHLSTVERGLGDRRFSLCHIRTGRVVPRQPGRRVHRTWIRFGDRAEDVG